MVFQHFALFDALTVAENVWLGLDASLSRSEVKTRVAAVAADFGLEIEGDRLVFDLSVGERQRVEILRALLTNPRLLILDEPTSVLTPQAAERLFALLRGLSAGGLLDPVHQPQARRGAGAVHARHRAARRAGDRRLSSRGPRARTACRS